MSENKRKINKAIIISICVLTCILALVGGYIYYITSTKLMLGKVTKNSIKKAYETSTEIRTNPVIEELKKDVLNKDVEISFRGESTNLKDKNMLDLLNNIKLNAKVSKDKKDLISNIKLVYNGSEIIAVDTVNKDYKTYTKIKDIDDKYYYQNNVAQKMLTLKEEDIKYFMDATYNEIVSKLSKENMYSQPEKITVGEQNFSTVKHTIEIPKTKKKEIVISLCDKILNDTKYQEIAYRLDNDEKTKEQFIAHVQNEKAKLANKVYDDDEKINMYINPFTTALIKLEYEKIGSGDIDKFEVITLKEKNRDLKVVKTENGKEKYNLEIKEIDENNFTIVYKEKRMKYNIVAKVKDTIELDSEVYINDSLNSTSKTIIRKEGTNISMDVTTDLQKQAKVTCNIVVKDSVEKLQMPNLENAVLEETVSEAEKEARENKLIGKILSSGPVKDAFTSAMQQAAPNVDGEDLDADDILDVGDND